MLARRDEKTTVHVRVSDGRYSCPPSLRWPFDDAPAIRVQTDGLIEGHGVQPFIHLRDPHPP